ncbi:MAG: RnfABCDGE type electron transport complex subunit B [Spirochaetaceae bacterium]|jgi:Na+-translocating ferredoxin:NAD+ oxidoreductase RNF subunit RnfB|nr:RnfABCDGE type electron transport complex subunit B [Spirochaetaceae bacterium]
MNIVLLTALFAAVLAFVLGTALGFFKKFFYVETDPRISQIREMLPGVNCGACGYPGCDGYAAAIAGGGVEITRCAPGGQGTASKLSALMGVSAELKPVVAVVACGGSKDIAPLKGLYAGIPSCRGAKLSAGGTKLCSWGCLGFGDCTAVCPFDAIHMGDDGLPHVDYDACTGCKKCIAECPQQLIREVPRDRKGAVVGCSNRNPLRAMIRKTCKVGCIKCGICVKNCPEQCIVIENGIPQVDYAKCTSCGTCNEKCPTKIIKILQDEIFAEKDAGEETPVTAAAG